MATRAVFLDALGTLVALEPPAPRLADALGVPLDAPIEAAIRAEMAYYRDHAHEGRDEKSLATLRQRCADLVSSMLAVQVSPETLMSAIRFRAFPDAKPVLEELRSKGLTTICVSNWDVSLPDVLAGAGLAELLDGVVTSAATGARKPDPAIFQAALELAGCGPDEAIHVGDTPSEDIDGAAAAGITSVLVVREPEPLSPPAGVPVISSLTEIGHHLPR